ncbi:MAG: NAD-dependent protein deacylase [Bacillota bacterium]|nr:NAD-dependent protein deacylase [Bacillota bacterium]
MKNEILQLAEMMKKAQRISFLGGAGVSTESGIPDFRGAKGLYMEKREIPPETILSHSFFMREPEVFYKYYTENLLPKGVQPNAAHRALSELEKMGKLLCVITQNIDGLHQMAGSKKVLELHGTALSNYCMRCKKTYDTDYILSHLPLPKCDCGGLIRPDVVLYEEGLNDQVMREAAKAVSSSDMLIVGGTSLNVYPAASYARMCPGTLVIINKTPTPYDDYADLVIRDPIGQTLSSALQLMKQGDDSQC